MPNENGELYVQLASGDGRFVLRALEVRQITAYVALSVVPSAPETCAGLMNFHGRPVPVIDLGVITRGVRTEPLLGSRVVVAAWDEERLLGILCDACVETRRIKEEEFVQPGISSHPAGGKVAPDGSGVLQRLLIPGFLDAKTYEALMKAVESGSAA